MLSPKSSSCTDTNVMVAMAFAFSSFTLSRPFSEFELPPETIFGQCGLPTELLWSPVASDSCLPRIDIASSSSALLLHGLCLDQSEVRPKYRIPTNETSLQLRSHIFTRDSCRLGEYRHLLLGFSYFSHQAFWMLPSILGSSVIFTEHADLRN